MLIDEKHDSLFFAYENIVSNIISGLSFFAPIAWVVRSFFISTYLTLSYALRYECNKPRADHTGEK